jgi:predicted nucleic acid-binding protein
MRFWDSSAIVPLCLDQPSSGRARELLGEDPEAVVWWTTPVECASAFARLRRQERLTYTEEETALRLLRTLQRSWYEVVPGDRVRAQALRLLRLHPLRAADSLQLAAAVEWAGSPASGDLVTFDERLGLAGRLEGFDVRGLQT